jgi:hypothetical protein
MEAQVPTALLIDCLASLALLENHHMATLTVGPTSTFTFPGPPATTVPRESTLNSSQQIHTQERLKL